MILVHSKKLLFYKMSPEELRSFDDLGQKVFRLCLYYCTIHRDDDVTDHQEPSKLQFYHP